MNVFRNYIEMRLGLGWLAKKMWSFQRLVRNVYRGLNSNTGAFDKCLYMFKNG